MTAKVENMEFESLLIALQNGQIDAAIAGMTVTEDRIAVFGHDKTLLRNSFVRSFLGWLNTSSGVLEEDSV